MTNFNFLSNLLSLYSSPTVNRQPSDSHSQGHYTLTTGNMMLKALYFLAAFLFIGVCEMRGTPTTIYSEGFGSTNAGNATWATWSATPSNLDDSNSPSVISVSGTWKVGTGNAKTVNNLWANSSAAYVIFSIGSVSGISSYTDCSFSFYVRNGAGTSYDRSYSVYTSTDGGDNWSSYDLSVYKVQNYRQITISVPDANRSTFAVKLVLTGNHETRIDDVLLTGTAAACATTVTPAEGTKTNVSTITFGAASVATCSSTASERRVTVTITPASCYSVPSSTRLTATGTSASYVSGPTDNGNGTYSFVYEFAKDASGTSTFAASLDTKTTYTVQYNAGSTSHTGGNAISGSHANDTKTCGTNLTLPGVTFTTTGYTQTGWTKTDGGSKTNNLGGSYTTDAAQTFYPAWTANNYTVTWKVNGVEWTPYTTTGSGTDGSDNANYGTKVSTLPTAPTTSEGCGNKFMGWTDAAIDGSQNSAPAVLFTTAESSPAITDNTTFHAVFADYGE